MTSTGADAGRFTYDSFELEPATGRVLCRYRLGEHRFTETFAFDPEGHWDDPAVGAAARLLFLLAGVSYYKAGAPGLVDLGPHPSSAAERAVLTDYYVNGLGEFAYRNGLDLRGLEVVGPDDDGPAAPVAYAPRPGRPLVPFGGGIDSIVVVESVRQAFADAALFVASRAGDRFDAIEAPAALTGLRVLRAERELDPAILRSAEHGFLNGHVPVTAVISAMAVVAAVLDGRDAVVMSNEWSASVPTVVAGDLAVNHQWSKGIEFERDLRSLLAGSLGDGLEYFSLLRPYTELWVARRFAALDRYHLAFRSCNRAFYLDRTERLDHWCGRCDKCCFIDLILSPFMPASTLRQVFDGHEPLDDLGLLDAFCALTGAATGAKPFECVGDADECRAAALLAAGREDRRRSPVLGALVPRLGASGAPDPARLLRPQGQHYIPDSYAPEDQLVRTP